MKLAGYILMITGAVVLAGCGSGYDQLAPSATVAMAGAEPMTLQAPGDGEISIFDLSIDNLIYSGHIRKGQLLVIDPVNKNVTVNGLVANTNPLYGGDTFKIVFDADK